MSSGRVAILGAGMLGACTALELARRGRRVVLVDRAAEVMQHASRWNEGKIHLGYLYPADPSLNTAARLIPAGLAFTELVERLTGRSLDGLASDEDVYLVHRDSVVGPDVYETYAATVTRMLHDAVRSNPRARYLGDLTAVGVHRLSESELGNVTSSDAIVAGFRVPERSVSTVPVADAITAAVRAEPRIEVRTGVDVRSVRRRDDGRLDVITAEKADGLRSFDTVVNALWEGRPLVDAELGLKPPGAWSHRLRAAIYAAAGRWDIRGATICTGPFGDVKRYADGRAYLSWYDAGLLAQGNELAPPCSQALLTDERLARARTETLAGLSRFFPDVARFPAVAESIEVHAGWVYAVGEGSLADPASSLHRRDRFAITADRGYVSIDTGKYSAAPWLASRVTSMIADAAG